jgi:glycosyltransferase involved in cell wall biosynthesis
MNPIADSDKSRRSELVIIVAVTSALSWVFFAKTIGALQAAGFRPILVSSPGEQLWRISRDTGAEYAAIPMKREIAPLRDLLSLFRLCRLIHKVRPTIIDAGTPKAGLLAGIAAWLMGVRCRIYTLHGLRMETTTGLKRMVLTLTERIACACAHKVICVSPSLRERALDFKLLRATKLVVLGSGSCGGVDVERFSPEAFDQVKKQQLADSLGISRSAPLIGFVGRLTRDKGVGELAAAYSMLRKKWPELCLLLVGDYEDGDPVEPLIRQQIDTDPGIIRAGFVADTAPYYGLMNILVLPTYREGFPYTTLEAQACRIPVVTTTATGAIDAVVNGETGFVVPVANAEILAIRIDQLLGDPELQERMGKRGRDRVIREFRNEIVERALLGEYEKLIAAKVGRPVPEAARAEPGIR